MNAETQAKWDSAAKQLSENMDNLPEDRRERFTKMRELQQKFREEAKSYLTEEQYANFEKNNPARRSRGRSGISAEQLGLEGDVKAKYESATEKMREQMRAMFSGGGGGSREELMEKMTTMREALEAEIKTILSPEQFKKYQELRSQQSQGGGRSRGQESGNSPSESQ
jgi:Spy/CpxP family protein refolding chaperone